MPKCFKIILVVAVSSVACQPRSKPTPPAQSQEVTEEEPPLGRPYLDVEIDPNSEIQARICDHSGHCAHGTLPEGEIAIPESDGTVSLRTCAKSDNKDACQEWVELPPMKQEEPNSLNGGEIAGIVLGVSAGTIVSMGFISRTSYYYRIKNYQQHATAIDMHPEKILKTPPQQKSFVFAYDLDMTLTDVSYKGSARDQGRVNLKEGVYATFLEHIRNGDKILIDTANVRMDVETFLMEQLGFDPDKADQVQAFRENIRVLQPDLPETLHNGQPLKIDKGSALMEGIKGWDKSTIAGIFVADDKTGFLADMLAHSSKDTPIVGFSVGENAHWWKNPIGAFFLWVRGVKEPAGKSTEFLTMARRISKERHLGFFLLENAQRFGAMMLNNALMRNIVKTMGIETTPIAKNADKVSGSLLNEIRAKNPGRYEVGRFQFSKKEIPIKIRPGQIRVWSIENNAIQKPAPKPIRIR